MSDSSKEFNNNSATDVGKKYVEKTIDYYRLKLFKLLAENTSNLIKFSLISLFSIATLLFLSLALAIYLGNFFNNIVLGYLIVAGIYFIIIITIYLLRKSIDKKVLKTTNKIFK